MGIWQSQSDKQKDLAIMTRSLVLSAVALSNDFFQCARKLGRLIGVEFHDKPTATLERNPHDDPTSLFGYFHRAVTRPRFHCCHRASSSCSDLANVPSQLFRIT